MSRPNLGRLERVDLRCVWGNESGDFTPWLAREENIALLGEAIGLILEVEARERAVGPFFADILCKDTADDSWVLIENQLERTDHTHLGQVLTYAAGLAAVTIVWISPKFTEEHRAALDWLNEISDERFRFFGLEIELWRIGESSIAPKFNIVAKPNNWSRDVRQSATSGELTDVKRTQLAFWTAFRRYLEEAGSPIKCRTPAPKTSMYHTLGRSGCHLVSIASTWMSDQDALPGEIRVQIQLQNNRAEEYFEVLSARREEIERMVGEPLVWRSQDDTQRRRIFVRSHADILDTAKWPEYFVWLRARLESFERVFGPILRGLP